MLKNVEFQARQLFKILKDVFIFNFEIVKRWTERQTDDISTLHRHRICEGHFMSPEHNNRIIIEQRI